MKDLNNFTNPTFPGVLFTNNANKDKKTDDTKTTDPVTSPAIEVAEEED